MSEESSEPPIALLDLDPDLLLLVVEACGAQGQAVCKAACKLLALLVSSAESGSAAIQQHGNTRKV